MASFFKATGTSASLFSPRYQAASRKQSCSQLMVRDPCKRSRSLRRQLLLHLRPCRAAFWPVLTLVGIV